MSELANAASSILFLQLGAVTTRGLASYAPLVHRQCDRLRRFVAIASEQRLGLQRDIGW